MLVPVATCARDQGDGPGNYQGVAGCDFSRANICMLSLLDNMILHVEQACINAKLIGNLFCYGSILGDEFFRRFPEFTDGASA